MIHKQQMMTYHTFGTPYKGNLTGGMNYGYTGKPFDVTTGMYDSGYRDYQPSVARFTTVDPVRDGNNWFAYVNNDPVNWVDLWGLKPGDVFPTPDAAASDFGNNYNDNSINENREYWTTIVPKNDGYTYMQPTTGDVSNITLPTPPEGPDVAVAGAHTHSAYDPKYDGNNFSDTDKKTSEKYQKPFYLVTPNGSLKVYDPTTDTVTVINEEMPSDPKDPTQKNNNNAYSNGSCGK
ncbi:MAG: DUF4329 domain-containing protein [Spirochaetaceae bacterium]|jgi:RHS repeat-associated protein|nr:DUF4329 domain-containing protein [Spirochaetaceae bacterium]